MSRIDTLVAELCPDGVDYRNLYDITHFDRGQVITARDAVDGGIPVIAGGQKPAYYHNVSNRPAGTITVAGSGAYAGYVSLWETPIWLSDAFSIMPNDERELRTAFLYQFLKSNQNWIYAKKKGSGVPHVHGADLSRLKIPVPPIEVQREVVRILDTFTTLTDELTAKLAEEVTARRQQYAYYRDRLLSQESLEALEGKSVEVVRLGEVSDMLTGFPFKSKEFEASGIKVARGINVKRGSMVFDDGNTVCWKSSDGLEKYLLNCGDILVAMDGSLVGKSFGMIAASDLPAMLGQRVTRVRCSEIDPRFVFHIIASGTLEAMVDKKKTAGAVPHVSLKDIQSIEIPVPSLATQQAVVDILDRFDALTTSLTDGIPAEIEARKAQHAYYRDRLLDFPRKAIETE